MVLAAVWAVWLSPAAAQAPGGIGDNQDSVAANIIKRVPAGYRFFEWVRGDLNGDGMDDDVIVIKATGKKKSVRDDHGGGLVDRNRRGIMIFFNSGNDYKLVLENRQCFTSENEDGGVYYAPELEISIEKGNLYFHYAHGRYGWWKYTFRYRKSDFELIGYDNNASRGPRIENETSINFLSNKMLTKTNKSPYCGDDDYECMDKENDVLDKVWSDIIVKEPIKLSKIAGFDMFDIMSYIQEK
jgi:hypothetical protein